MANEVFIRIQIHLFAICVCLAMLVDTQHHISSRQYSFRLFRALLVVCILLLGTEAASWYSHGLWKVIWNTACFSLHAVPGYFFSLYVDYQLSASEEELQRHRMKRLLPLLAAEGLVLANFFTPLLFSIDADGIYHRAALFAVDTALSYSYLVYTFVRICLWRFRLDRSSLRPLIFFHIFPLVGGAAQFCFYGSGLAWPSVAFALLICYIYIQNRQLGTDYLTSASNRLQVDRQLRHRLQDGSKQPFSALMLDIDNFKRINDAFGHLVGDEALVQTVQLLRQSLRYSDFLARYGGDEFLILTDIHKAEDLDGLVERIQAKFVLFNQQGDKPYQLTLSIGYATFDPQSGQTPEQFLALVDQKMYREKQAESSAKML